MEHRRQFKEEVEIVDEGEADESPDEVQKSALSDPSPQTRDLSVQGRGRVWETGSPVSASLGAMRALVRKLDMLLLDPPHGCSSESVKDKMQLLKKDVEEISSCLDTLSQLEDPPQMAKCWMNEVRDLSYNMEDYIDSLHVQAADTSLDADSIKTTISHRKWFSRVRTPKKPTWDEQIVGTVSEFKIYVHDAMKRHKMYGLKFFSTLRRTLAPVVHMLPTPTPYGETSDIVINDRMNEFINSLANDGADPQQLKVSSVLGSACLGKTTLARVSYKRIGLQFDCRAFVRVSKNPDMKKIFRDMLSQLERQQCPPQYTKEGDLINKIKKFLQDKRYLIIIDDLWSASVWDSINRAFPKVSHGSRIITTTQLEDVAFRCCRYQSGQVFEMKPLDDRHSRMLFFNRVFGSESNCPEQFKKVSNEIVAMCGGFPLATINIASLLASQPVTTEDLLKHIHESLSSLFLANPTSERTRQALNLSFNNLPQYLKTCLLYVSMYEEGYTFCKNDLVKQWMAEGFIDTTKGEDKEKVAESYLHQLIGRRFIQPIRINYNNEVFSCAVHDLVHDFIAHKSAEENFIVKIDQSAKNMPLSHKVRRLSLLFGDARYAKTPANITKSQVRSLRFFGLLESMPCITEFKLLRVLNLQLFGHAGNDDNPVDLTGISEMFQLRYLKIAGNVCIKLPNHVLQCLEILDITDARVACVPRDIHLPNLLHLGLPVDKNLSEWINRRMSLGVERVRKLHALQDLHLTRSSTLSSDHLNRSMGSILSLIGGHGNLKTVVVAHGSSSKNARGASDVTLSWDLLAPPLLQRFEFSPHSRIVFPQIPLWIEEHGKLRILKIAVQELRSSCVGTLRTLPALTALSLYVEKAPYDKIIFDKAGFSVLKYFKLRFRSGIAWIKFEEGAMPNLWKLKLVFNAIPSLKKDGTALISIEHMPGLKEISTKFGGEAADLEYALRTLVSNHPSNPIINMPTDKTLGKEQQYRNLKQESDEIRKEEEPYRNLEQESDEILDEQEPDEYDERLKKQPADKRCKIRKHVSIELFHKPGLSGPEDFAILPAVYNAAAMSHLPKPTCHRAFLEASPASRAEVSSSSQSEISEISSSSQSEISEPNRRLRKPIRSWSRGVLLGNGSFGSVYEGISYEGVFFAVREVSLVDQGINAKQHIIQLEHEVSLLSRLEHDNIVNYYGTDKEDGKMYIFVELVTQGSLVSLYQKYRLRDTHVSAYTREILNGLNYLHQRNVLHGDIKCANILICANGSVKLADFGLVKEMSMLRSRKRSVYWMAPEVAMDKPHGLPADIWSLGCTVLEMLTRQLPYPDLEWTHALLEIGRGVPPKIPNTLSKDSRDFIARCVQTNQKDRPSAAQLLEHPFVNRSRKSPAKKKEKE